MKMGDLVEVSWLTPSGKVRTVQGQVLEIKGDKVRIEYEHTTACSWRVVQCWRKSTQCKVIGYSDSNEAQKTGSFLAGMMRESYLAKESAE